MTAALLLISPGIAGIGMFALYSVATVRSRPIVHHGATVLLLATELCCIVSVGLAATVWNISSGSALDGPKTMTPGPLLGMVLATVWLPFAPSFIAPISTMRLVALSLRRADWLRRVANLSATARMGVRIGLASVLMPPVVGTTLLLLI